MASGPGPAWRLRYLHASRLASRWRRRTLLATHGHADVAIDRSAYLGPRFSVWIPSAARLHIGPGCEFRRDTYVEIAADGAVEIGADTKFVAGTVIQISTSLTIGRRCVLGSRVLLADGNHRFRDHTRNVMDQGYEFRPVTVGDGAMILANAVVLAAVGEGAVVGANSVVTRPVPAHCLAVGAPARVVEYFGPADQAPQLSGTDVP